MEDKKLSKLLKGDDVESSPNSEQTNPNHGEVKADKADPNSIVVDIRSEKPIVVFYGPRSIGKTVALIRLSKYLDSNGFTITPDRNFRKEDTDYQELCDTFNESFLNTAIAPKSTSAVNFLLLRVKNNNGDICQLLEAPGEHFFDLDDYDNDYPPYLSKIFSSETPKIYILFLELDWGNRDQFDAYNDRIDEFIGQVRKNDHLILLCNKADKQKNYITHNKPDVDKFRYDCESQYRKVFDRLGRKKGLLKFFSPELHPFEFVVFSAGTFKDRSNEDDQAMTPGPKYYPNKLWGAISQGIKGRWI